MNIPLFLTICHRPSPIYEYCLSSPNDIMSFFSFLSVSGRVIFSPICNAIITVQESSSLLCNDISDNCSYHLRNLPIKRIVYYKSLLVFPIKLLTFGHFHNGNIIFLFNIAYMRRDFLRRMPYAITMMLF